MLRGGTSFAAAQLKPASEEARCESACFTYRHHSKTTFVPDNPLIRSPVSEPPVSQEEEMVMEKPSAQLVGREFVRQYYTLLNQAPDYLHRFYGKNSSYVHGGLDANGKPLEAVYGQSDIHKRVMALSFRDCHTKIRHVDAHATLNEGVVVQVMGELSNNMQPMRKFMQTFVLAPEGTVANKFYVHNDVFRYQDEVFADSDSEAPEESEDEVEEMEERIPSPDILPEESSSFYEPPPCSEAALPTDDVEAAASPEPEPEGEKEADGTVADLKQDATQETQSDAHTANEQTEKGPALNAGTEPAEPAPVAQEENKPFSWASVTSKNLPPSGAVPVSGIPPHVVKATPTAPARMESKSESQTSSQRPQRDQRPREQRPPAAPPVHRGPRAAREGEQGEVEGRRAVRYPDAHQLFVGNVPHDADKSELKEFFEQYGTVLELRINSGGKLPNFGFVIFDASEPVQKILSSRPIKLRGDVRLNVEEKKARSAREGDRRDVRPRGPGGPGGPRERISGGGPRGPPTRGGNAQKPSFGSGRGAGPSEGRYSAQRQ
ncbi:ras GTPase-activating protein-binding protein 1 [Dunckerocampus dactyliophorus]|uniref:ras GTPase-activating protein-binding protein 1 n=1 Tax=Dunckerocampus dactyliophorus TaxID=161453 RepID=UPI002407153D|nr:ras GTPase-activating protein-binding protein 1 [Dunckerocampus dactyliophorus]